MEMAVEHDILDTTDDQCGQYVTFALDDEEYAVDVYKVQEIIGYKAVTKIPRVASFIRGVMNLRGTVVPIIDLREKFGMVVKTYDKFTVVLIVEVSGRVLGVVVDAVSDVVSLGDGDIRPAPKFSTKIDTQYIRGLAEKDDKFLIMLDIDRVLSREELAEVDASV